MIGNTVDIKVWGANSANDKHTEYYEPVDTRGYCDSSGDTACLESLLSMAVEEIIEEVQSGTFVLLEGQSIEVQIQEGVEI